MLYKVMLIFQLFLVCMRVVEGQPGVTFDPSIPCWFNLTDDMNLTYTEELQMQIAEYVNETIIQPVSLLPPEEQGAALVKLIPEAQEELRFNIAPSTSLGDFHYIPRMTNTRPVQMFPEALRNNPENFFAFVMPNYVIMSRGCVEGQTQPDMRFVLRHGVEKVGGFFIRQFFRSNDLAGIVNATAIALIQTVEAVNFADLDLETIILEVVEGLAAAYKGVADAQIDLESITETVVNNILSIIGGEEAGDVDIMDVVSNVTTAINIDVDDELLAGAISTAINGLLDGSL